MLPARPAQIRNFKYAQRCECTAAETLSARDLRRTPNAVSCIMMRRISLAFFPRDNITVVVIGYQVCGFVHAVCLKTWVECRHRWKAWIRAWVSAVRGFKWNWMLRFEKLYIRRVVFVLYFLVLLCLWELASFILRTKMPSIWTVI